jgi:two-component sensor histidine kinase
MILLAYLLVVTMYALHHNNRQTRYTIVGWVVFFSSALFMYLSSLGIYDIFSTYPYYTEFALLVEAIAFSYSLADKYKQVQQEKLYVQKQFINYQKEETQRLSSMVKEKTLDLEKSLNEKKLLLKELNHRVKNSMQTIISFVRLQKNDTQLQEIQNILSNLENKIFAINDLYALLHTSNNVSTINANTYFALLIKNIQKSFNHPKVDIHLDANIILDSDNAVYCGFILNEALTNAYQHAFLEDYGRVNITLKQEDTHYFLTIEDNGIGYTHTETTTLGLLIIDTLARIQLEGNIEISTFNGVKIKISWENNG